jgi:hypothetical protein
MTAQHVADRLVGDVVAEIGQRTGDPVVAPELSRAICTINCSISGLIFGRPGQDRCFEPSNF